MGEVPAAGGRRGRRGQAHAHLAGTSRRVDPARPRAPARARRGPPGGGRARATHDDGRAAAARPATTGSSGDARLRAPAVGGIRDVPAPDDVARDYLLLASASTSTCPGPSTATSAPPSSRRTVDMEQLRSPARLAEDAAALRAAPRRRGPRAAIAATGSTSSWSRSRPWPGSRPASRSRTSTRSRAASRSRPERRPDARFEPAAASSTTLLPGDRHARRPAGRRGRAPGPSRPTASRPSSTSLVAAVPGSRRAPLFGLPDGRGPARLARPRPAVVRLQLVRRRLPLARRPQPRPPDPAARPRRHRRPRDVPGAPPRARAQGAGARRGARPPRGGDPAHQHARVPDLRGPRATSARVRASRRTRCPACSSSWRRSPGCRWPSDRGALRDGRDARTAADRATCARSLAEARVNAALMLHEDGAAAGTGDRLPRRGRADWTRTSAAKRLEFIAHPLWRLYDLRLHRGRGAAAAAGSTPCRAADAWRGSGGCSASSSTPPAIRAETAGGGGSGGPAAGVGPDRATGSARRRCAARLVGRRDACHRPRA